MLLLCALIIGSVSSAWGETKTSTLTFAAKCNGSGTADDGASWTVTSDGSESTFESDKGIHYGTSKAAVQYIKLTTSGISGTITQIVVNASTASDVSATASVTVGGSAFGGDAQSLSTTATDYTFTGSASGEIIVTVTKPSSAKKALYVKSVVVTYTTKNLSSITASGYKTTFYEKDAFEFDGTVTAHYDDSTTGDVTEDATFTGYDMSSTGNQTVTVSYGGKTTSYDITVNERPKFTVTFSDGGSLTEATASAGVTLPTRTNIGEYTFVGWAESSVPTGTESVTTTAAGATYKPTANTTLYPVYSYNVYGAAIEWQEISDVPEDGEYVIAADTYAMKADISSNRFANATVEIVSGTPAILKDEPTSDYIWEIAKDGSAYTIKNGSNYAGTTSTDKQGALLTGDDAASDYAKWTITYDDGFVIVNNGKTGDYTTLRNNTTYGWAIYKSTTGNAPRLFKKTNVMKATSRYTSEPTATVSIDSKCTDGKNYYGTYSNSSAFIVPADLTVSAISVEDNKLTVTNYNKGDIVKANTGVMVSSTTAGDHTIILSDKTGTEIAGNMLKASGDAGIDAATMNEANKLFYRLTMHNGTDLGFYWGAANGAAFDITANKAYLAVVPKTADARIAGFNLFENEGEATAIEGVKTIGMDAPVFNLNGQRVNGNAKGLLIKNGKKYMNR